MEAMKKVFAVIMVIITVIIVMNIIGHTAGPLKEGADGITEAHNCSEGEDNTGATLTYNSSNGFCLNSTGDKEYAAGYYDLPMNSLFGKTGVVFLCLMAGLLIGLITLVLKFRKH